MKHELCITIKYVRLFRKSACTPKHALHIINNLCDKELKLYRTTRGEGITNALYYSIPRLSALSISDILYAHLSQDN